MSRRSFGADRMGRRTRIDPFKMAWRMDLEKDGIHAGVDRERTIDKNSELKRTPNFKSDKTLWNCTRMR